MKLSYWSLLFLSGVLSQNLSSGTNLREDLTNLCDKITKSHFHSRTLKETKDPLNPDEKIWPTLEDFAKLCGHVKNISYSLEWFENDSLDGYLGMEDLKTLAQTLLPLVIQRVFTTNKHCFADVLAFIANLKNGPDDWPMKMLDASGKPLSGILKGAVHWTGDFDQCTSINMPFKPGNITEQNPLIRGQYCTMHIAIPEYVKKILIPAHLNAVLTNILESLEIKWDFCSTQHCSYQDHKYILEPIFDLTNKTFGIELTDLTCKKPVQVLKDKTAIGTLALIGVICVFLLIGTLYDILCCGKSSEFDEGTFITDDIHTDIHFNSHYNNAYEMDNLSYDSSTNSFNNKSKDGDDTENGPNEITVVSARSTESYPANKAESSNTSRRRTPMAPAQPKPETPTSPPQLQPLPGVSNSVADLNSNQNANTLNINGQISSTKDRAEHDIFKDKTSSDRGFGTFLLAFSVRRNAYRLLNTEHPVEILSCLNGIRFLSMAWIILGQTYKIATEDYIKNLIDGIDVYQRFTFQAVLAAPFAVDTFFLLSGILVTYFFLENYYNKGNIGLKTVLLIYVRRYLRLTPCYAVILMIYTFLLPNLFDGPYWKFDFSEVCQSRWWTNLLYINNIFKLEHGCMSWTWYLANDMQFFLISPIILCQFILLPSFAFLTIVLLFAAYIISSVILWQRLLDPNIHTVTNDDIYTKPWCRISPFLIGIMLGYFLQQKSRKRSFPKFLQLCGWIFTASTCLFLSYIKYTMNRKENPATWLNSQYTAYEVVSHPLWSMAISWVIIVCASGNGGVISDILSWKFWILLSRLTYGAYLIHPIVIMLALRMGMTPFYLSIPTTIYAFIGHLTLSYGVSFIVSLLFEMPIRMMEKVISNRT